MTTAQLHATFRLHPAEAARLVATLTRRERQTAETMAMGLRHKDAARELGIRPPTLHVYKRRVREKLGCETGGVGRVWFCAAMAGGKAS